MFELSKQKIRGKVRLIAEDETSKPKPKHCTLERRTIQAVSVDNNWVANIGLDLYEKAAIEDLY